MNPRPIRVLVVDDSAFIRASVTRLLEADPSMVVVGHAADGEQALARTRQLRPDVVTLDLHMPVMDGLQALGYLIRDFSQPVVVLSTLAVEGSFNTFRSLALGAVDFVTKPSGGAYLASQRELGEELRAKVRVAATVSRSKIGARKSQQPPARPAASLPTSGGQWCRCVLAVGGSTGGTVALETLLRSIPAHAPLAVVVVQHMPKGFTRSFAEYLDSACGLTVREAAHGARVEAHHVYLAPGGHHLRVRRECGCLRLKVGSAPLEDRGYRPSIDLLLYSLACAQGSQAVGVLLSGLGADGVFGLRAVRRVGGRTIVQDRASCIVSQMAARAVTAGVVDAELPPEGMIHRVTDWFAGARSTGSPGWVPDKQGGVA
jgi:two-component system chemotaxis response regulator CheB